MRAKDNPFSTDRVLRVRYQPVGIVWSELLERARSLGFRAALVGPHGTGKTTLLEDFAGRLPALGLTPRFYRLDADSRRAEKRALLSLASSLTAGDCLLLDGAEQLSAWWWLLLRWHAREAGGLLLTQHRPGRLPTLWLCETSPALLAYLTAQLVPEPLSTGEAESLHQRHRGNLREVWRELYDRQSAVVPVAPRT